MSKSCKRRLHYKNLKDLGDCHAAMGDFKLAGMSYQQASELAPQEAEPRVGLGNMAVRMGDLKSAAGHYKAAIAVDSACAEAYGGLAVVYQQTHEYSAAFEMYMKCLELDQDNLIALLGLFQASCQMGTFAHITKYLQVYLSKHPEDTSVLFCLATLYARDGKLDEARKAILKVLAVEPGKTEAAKLLAQIERKLSRSSMQENPQ